MDLQGLGQPAAPQRQTPIASPGMAQADTPEAQADGTAASPELQDAYNRFVGRATMILWSEPVSNGLRERLQKAKDHVSVVGDFSAQVGLKAIKDGLSQGEQTPPAVALHGAREIVTQAGEIAEKAGRPLQPPELESAYYLAVDRARAAAQKEGLLDMKAVERENSQLGQMKQDGRLDQVWGFIQKAHQEGAKPTPKPLADAAKGAV